MAPSEPTARNQETAVYSQGGFELPPPEELARRLPNLEVLELLGSGGMGVVYKGRQPLLDRLVAIKVIRPDLGTDGTFQERFLREGRALAKLRHPFIVTVFDIQQAGDLYCLVMEYVEGSSLRQLLQEGNGSITERRTLDYVPQITEALQHAHEAGVIHRDIKPENVLVDSRGRVRLVDQDLVRLARTPETCLRVEQYIPAPPEQVFAAWVDPAQMGDWFAPSAEFGPTIGEVDPQVGGSYRIMMFPPGANDPHVLVGQYCTFDEPRTLSFTWAHEPLKPGWTETQATLDFQPRGDGTHLVLTHERFRSEPDKRDHTNGWRGCLGRLSVKFGG